MPDLGQTAIAITGFRKAMTLAARFRRAVQLCQHPSHPWQRICRRSALSTFCRQVKNDKKGPFRYLMKIAKRSLQPADTAMIAFVH
jgi:hypothetical protein